MKPTIPEHEGRISDLMERSDLRRVSLDKLFGFTHEVMTVRGARGIQRVTQGAALPVIPAYESLQEAYVSFTGDEALAQFGRHRINQIYNGPTFLSALGETLGKLLMKDYRPTYRSDEIMTDTTSPSDFRVQDRVRIKYVDDLPTVDEDGPLEEISVTGDEKSSYAVITKAAKLTITRRAMLANDVQGIERTVAQMGRAASRTLAKRIWNKVISNANYGVDGLPMFHTDHANLGATALSAATLTAAREAIYAQMEPGSSERLGLSGPFLLVIPIELESTALPLNFCEKLPGSATDGNPWYHRFGPNGERIFVNPLMTDANDWILFDVGGNAGIIEVGYLMGKQFPQIVVANDEREGQMLSQDRIVYKMRHEYETNIADYRAAYKAVVT